MWKIMVCDDEAECRNSVIEMLRRYEKECGESFDITVCTSGEELLKRFNSSFDLLLLDIQMKTLSGMNAARALRQRGSDVQIIFITAMSEYAIEGYEVHAFGFLKKPVHYRQLAWQIDDVLSALKKKRGVSIVVQDGNVIKAFKSSDIAWAEVFGHEVKLHLSGGDEQRCTTPLAKLEEQLAGSGFFRVHKSFLVNMNFIKAIDLSTVSMESGSEVPLSKHRKQDFIYAFGEFKGLV